MAQPYASALIESLRGAGIPGATLGGDIMYLDYPWMRNTIAALRQRPAKSYLSNPETLFIPQTAATTTAAAGGGSAAFLGGTPNPNTIGETIPEKKTVVEALAETGTAAVPQGTPLEMAEEQTGSVSVEELLSAEDGELADLNQRGVVVTVEELPAAPPLQSVAAPPPTAAAEPEPEPEVAVTVEEIAEPPAAPPPAQPTVREIVTELVQQSQPEPIPEPEPEVAITVEEVPTEPPPPPPPPEPTLEEIIDYITALTQATPSAPEQEAEPETSVTVEELPTEEYSGDGRPSGGMPFLSGLAQEMAMIALLGSSLNDANPRGEITIEELLGE